MSTNFYAWRAHTRNGAAMDADLNDGKKNVGGIEKCQAKDPATCPFHGTAKLDKTDAADPKAGGAQAAQPAPSDGGSQYVGAEGMRSVKPEEFLKTIEAAKASRPESDRWRVDVKDIDDYKKCKALMVSPGGSCVAVKQNGDIVSVCRKDGDRTVKGSDLLKTAFANGGNKLDSFDGNWSFYTRNGLHPISWTPFNELYKPDGWDAEKHAKEPVVFFVKGEGVETRTPEEWYGSTPKQEDDPMPEGEECPYEKTGYGKAEKIRDDFLAQNATSNGNTNTNK